MGYIPLTLVSDLPLGDGKCLRMTCLKSGILVEVLTEYNSVVLSYPKDREQIFSLFNPSDLPDEKHFLGYRESPDSQVTLPGL